MKKIKIIFWPLLYLLSFLYRIGFSVLRSMTKERSVDLKVISVGNITTGGTGKTPMLLKIIDLLNMDNDRKIAVITRGYKRKKKGLAVADINSTFEDIGDEPLMIKRKYPGVEMILSADRYVGAGVAMLKGADIVLLDDGFQSFELKRDINIVMIDTSRPLANNSLLPLGSLREPVSTLKRANAVVLTRINNVFENNISKIEETIKRIAPAIKIFKAKEKIIGLRKINSDITAGIAEVSDKEFIAISAIGNPAAFHKSLSDAGLRINKTVIKRDHHVWTETELNDILKESIEVITTEKDEVKFPEIMKGKGWVAVLDLEIEGIDELKELINK